MPDNDLTTHVRRMREKLGITQQELAHRMKKAISTVVRYESTRAPSGKALVELAEFASSEGLEDYEQIFTDALVAEMGLRETLPRTGFERLIVGATLKMLRSGDSNAVNAFLKTLSGLLRAYVKKSLLEEQPSIGIAIDQILTAAYRGEIVLGLSPKSAALLNAYRNLPLAVRLREHLATNKEPEDQALPKHDPEPTVSKKSKAKK